MKLALSTACLLLAGPALADIVMTPAVCDRLLRDTLRLSDKEKVERLNGAALQTCMRSYPDLRDKYFPLVEHRKETSFTIRPR